MNLDAANLPAGAVNLTVGAVNPANQAILPMAPALVLIDRHIRTFSQLYGDENKDLCKQNYRAIMNHFDANRDNALQGNVLYSQVVSMGGDVPQAYLCCGVTNNVLKIYCLHMPEKFVATLDRTTTEWDDLSFAFLGNIVQGLVSIVLFLDDAFNSLVIPVRTVDYMLQHQDKLTNHFVFPPVLQDEDDYELIVTRSFMYLPAVYVPLMLNSRGYKAKQMWEILYPAIIQRQEQDICKLLIQWLQVASTGIAQVNPLEVGPPLISLVLNALLADETLLTHRHAFLHIALPGLSAPPQALETALAQMVMAIVAQMNDNC